MTTAPYTVHVGPIAAEWPPQVAEASTRAEAQRLASERLKVAPKHCKAEVRLRVVLLDCYGQSGEKSVRHVYSARQRGGAA